MKASKLTLFLVVASLLIPGNVYAKEYGLVILHGRVIDSKVLKDIYPGKPVRAPVQKQVPA